MNATWKRIGSGWGANIGIVDMYVSKVTGEWKWTAKRVYAGVVVQAIGWLPTLRDCKAEAEKWARKLLEVVPGE